MRRVLGTVALLAGFSAAAGSVITERAIIGTWECGPVTMHGPNFELVVTTRTINQPDHTFSTLATAVITQPGQSPVTNNDQTEGIWRLDGDVITTTVQRVAFLSSSDPGFSKSLGQQIQDAQLKKKSVYQSRIMAFDGTVSRSVPVNPMYGEASVESSCRRL